MRFLSFLEEVPVFFSFSYTLHEKRAYMKICNGVCPATTRRPTHFWIHSRGNKLHPQTLLQASPVSMHVSTRSHKTNACPVVDPGFVKEDPTCNSATG